MRRNCCLSTLTGVKYCETFLVPNEIFAFQCGYCTAGFLNEGQVLLDHLAKNRIARAELEKTIAEALDGHLCRCTGYIKYHEAVRDVILANPARYLI
ncbi:hypothetical protein AMST5_03924 [freshwater sediment metagenome]|uniref:[2Fe-2S]-binding domain-containing protein n=1 Tax=freshwater sediment metagenome TaxID=556182 RepID=A0AA48RF49_9ZZZZ